MAKREPIALKPSVKKMDDYVYKENPKKKKTKKDRKPITAYMTPETHIKLKIFAASNQKEISEVIEEAVLNYME